MTEDEARSWLAHLPGVSRETIGLLENFVAQVIAENGAQNLIGQATVPNIWARHVVDSAQLLRFADRTNLAHNWLDLGTGPGFPGLVTAIITGIPTLLVESRRRRYEFLKHVKNKLLLKNVEVAGCRVESLGITTYSIISARAFAPLPRLFELAHSFSTEKTLWLLPKGRSAPEELEKARGAWQGDFHVKSSLTDPKASIIVATNVRPKRRSA